MVEQIERLEKLIRKLLRYQLCVRPDMAIVDRQALDQAIAEIRAYSVQIIAKRTE